MNDVHKIMHFCPFSCRQDTQNQKNSQNVRLNFNTKAKACWYYLLLKCYTSHGI